MKKAIAKKSVLCFMIVIMMAVGMVLQTGGGRFAVIAQENSVDLTEQEGETTPDTPTLEEPDHSAFKNVVRELTAAELLDTYSVTDSTNQPYPSDWGIKIGKTQAGYEMVDNSSAAKDAPSGYFASKMPLTKSLDATVTDYTVKATVTGKAKHDWGGYGITFGWCNDMPLAVSYFENGSLTIAKGGNEFFKALTVKDGATLAAFGETESYGLKVSVSGGTAWFYVNDVLINTADFSDDEIVPAVGVAMKNYNAVYEDFALMVDAADEPDVPVIEPETPDDYAEETNLVVRTAGLLDGYGVTSEFKTQQPFPNDWGIKIYEKEDGVFVRTNNLTEEFANASFAAAFLPTSKNISATENYYIEATMKPTVRAEWGGAGIVIGKSTAEGTEDAPLTIWISEAGGVQITYDFNEWAATAGTTEFAIGTSVKLGAIVNGNKLVVYVNDNISGTVDLTDVEFTPAVGVAYKNYNAEISGVTFKTKEEVDPAEYTITQISGGVEIGSFKYTFGTAVDLPSVDRKGNTFMGWHLLPDLSDGVITSLPANIGGDVKIYCEYVVTSYSIKYYDGETEIDNDTLTKSYNYREYIALPEIAKEGYTFEGWYESADFSGDKVEAITMGSTGDKTFYAKYTQNASGGKGKKKKCGGSVASASLAVSVLALAAACVLLQKKRAENK